MYPGVKLAYATCLGLNSVPSNIRVLWEPRNGALFGNRVFADVMQLISSLLFPAGARHPPVLNKQLLVE